MDEFVLKLTAAAAILFALTKGQVQVRHEKEPEFLAPLENYTVTQGRDVYFTCVVNHLQSYKVAWIKSDTKTILALHTHMVALNPRLSVSHNGHDTWKLYVSNVQANDSGTYMCQVNTDPMRSQMGYLSVLIPPDIVDDDQETLKNDNGLVTHEGGSVRLHCSATGIPQPTLTWRREGGRNIFRRDSAGKEIEAVAMSVGERLQLDHVQRMDMGPYQCIASNGIPPSVSKRFDVRVLFHPMVKTPIRVVSAPVEADISLRCYVEASPKAMNSWFKANGEELLDGAKYLTNETNLNEYALTMNLTIRKLDKSDFGVYRCASSNALGKADGTVELKEIVLPPKTTTTTTSTTTTTTTTTTEAPATLRPRKKQGGKGGKQPDKKLTNHIVSGEESGRKAEVDPNAIDKKEKPARPTSKPQWKVVNAAPRPPHFRLAPLLLALLISIREHVTRFDETIIANL